MGNNKATKLNERHNMLKEFKLGKVNGRIRTIPLNDSKYQVNLNYGNKVLLNIVR